MIFKNLQAVYVFIMICIAGIDNPLLGQDQNNQTFPKINGHTFIPVSTISIPFTNSYFNSSLGGAQSFSTEFPLFELDGQTIFGETGNILLAQLGFQYQHRIKDWIAFNVSLQISSRIGTDIQSLVSNGINSVSGYQFQWILRIIEKEKYMLSGSFLVSNFTGNFISITGFIKDIIDNKPNPSLSIKVPATNAGTGLRFAYGFNDIFGLTLLGDLRFGEGLSRGTTGFTYKIGSALDINLIDRGVPIGFAISYLNSTVPENVFNEVNSYNYAGLKIAYTGAPDFSLGIEITYLRLPVSFIPDKIKVAGFLITTRYYFN